MESVLSNKEKRERQRCSLEKHQAKLKEFEERGAVQFREMVMWLDKIYTVTEQRMEAGLHNLPFDKEPKFESRIMIMEMANGLLEKMYHMVLMDQYFGKSNHKRSAVKEGTCSNEGNNILRCDWCGRWLQLTLNNLTLSLRRWCGGGEKVVSV